MKNFRTLTLAKSLYQECKQLPLRGHVKNQLERASLSICLNLVEGSAKQTEKERRRFYYIALGSQRETQCILEMEGYSELQDQADHIGASIYKLIQSIRC